MALVPALEMGLETALVMARGLVLGQAPGLAWELVPVSAQVWHIRLST
jgi:hypothetical protein